MTYKDFKEIFVKEYEEYTLLYEIVKRKQEAIINNDIEQLADILREEQSVIENIEELEEARQAVLNKLAEEKKEERDKPLSFAGLMELVPAEKEELEQLRDQFLQLLDKLQEINNENRDLIEDSLKITEASLEFIREATGRTNLYSNRNDETGVQTDHIIDKRV
ncbi:MAG TPA: flagellar protein FlgN [Halanaerobiales bacterium]|nr:flagellar protein FlgN [Halanaerobiales bacterium]HPZ63411.1 flagellar protein FlgN [Halanaerobiales bacterium]HQD04602.1 flagellar protein FlgN [Halanaerobiales bacterium]